MLLCARDLLVAVIGKLADLHDADDAARNERSRYPGLVARADDHEDLRDDAKSRSWVAL